MIDEHVIEVNRGEWVPFERALVYATQKHADQVRKSPEGAAGRDVPYMSHLLQVAGLVLEYGGDEDQAIAGLLHDVIEDHKASYEDVREEFGELIAQAD